MAIINKSQTPTSERDYWRTPPELISDALKLLNIKGFDVDVCVLSYKQKIKAASFYIPENEDALLRDAVWFEHSSPALPSFCNPPFSRKWEFFQKAIQQVKLYKGNVLMVLPYTPCTKEWRQNVSNADCVIYLPDGRYNYLLPDGAKPKNSCAFETCLVLIVPFKLGNIIVNYERG